MADLTLDNTMLQDMLSKNGKAFAAWSDRGASGTDARCSGTQGVSGFMCSPSDVSLSELAWIHERICGCVSGRFGEQLAQAPHSRASSHLARSVLSATPAPC